ncbi:hypothetical protein AB205_0028880 [Aquarana catesbeiana]|uniref:Immunoglobulin V-set domain-containing protein n=1 Tax=Aquarana catesbeiana TaxID=8400 RepID=A0A2G9QCZ0_AQUCT|nr:hypothetical protein AB205_0028880 [Aquarana catesbeiana]
MNLELNKLHMSSHITDERIFQPDSSPSERFETCSKSKVHLIFRQQRSDEAHTRSDCPADSFRLTFAVKVRSCVLGITKFGLVGTVKPSETLQLSCKLSTPLTGCWWNWVRKPVHRGLEWLAIIDSGGSTYYSQSLRSRLTLTRDNSKNEVYLSVTVGQGVTSQVTLTEFGPGTVKPSETLQISCKLSTPLTGYWWSWVHKPVNRGLEWLAQIESGGTTYYSQTLRSRLTTTRENSKN